MTAYSTPAEQQAFKDELGDNPFIICDLDGNILSGYTAADGTALTLAETDDPKSQSIPFGTSQETIQQLVDAGALKNVIFAEKAMDVRLPQPLVDMVNRFIEEDRPFAFAGLTSRSMKDALTVMRESGIHEPEKVTIVADSGASMYVNGQRQDVRKLSEDEKTFLDGVERMGAELQDIVRGVLQDAGLDADGAPELFIEPKGIATNVHYRTLLNHYGEKDGGDLDRNLGTALKAYMQNYVELGPQEEDGALTFKTLDGPATVEVKIAKVNKGHGLEALTAAAMTSKEPPSAIVFSGDDIAKGNGHTGTDYYAMVAAPEISAKWNVPILNVHTHHPVGADMNGTEPDPAKGADTLNAEYVKPVIHLTMASPAQWGGLIREILAGPAAPAQNLAIENPAAALSFQQS